MKKLIFILLIFPLIAFGQEQSPFTEYFNNDTDVIMASLNLGSELNGFNRIINYGNDQYVKSNLTYGESGYIEAMIRAYRITEDPVFIQNAL